MVPIRSFVRTDVGLRRDNNEDSHLADDEHRLYVVADGMGGHSSGEVASGQVVASIRAALIESWNRIKELAGSEEAVAHAELEAVMQRAYLRACADVFNLARKDPSRHGMGSTCVTVLCVGDKAVIGHVGDSRIYLQRQGSVHRLTEDHTLGAEQVRRGFITLEQMQALPTKNILLRAVGLQREVVVDTLVCELVAGDSLLLCSDGLHDGLPEPELQQALARRDLRDVPDELVASANERGGRDNSTAIVLQVGEVPLDAKETEVRAEVLRKVPLFEGLSYRDLLELLSISQAREYREGSLVVREGDPGEELFALVSGRVQVQKGGVAIAELRSGGYFGEMVLFDNAPRSATVQAAEDTTVVALERDGLLKLMQRNTELANRLLWSFGRVMATRLRSTSASLSESRGLTGS